MKKAIVLFVLLLCLSSVDVKASDDNEEEVSSRGSFIVSSEPSMPTIFIDRSGLKKDGNGKYLKDARSKWIAKVIVYNESVYNQKVIDVQEDDDSFNLFFEPKNHVTINNYINDNVINSPEEINSELWDVRLIKYIKPESMWHYNSAESESKTSSLLASGTNYDTKFTYYYAWSNGYYKVVKKSFSSYISIAADAMMAYTTSGMNAAVAWVISQAAHGVLSSFDHSLAITAETYNKYYYENKVCSVKTSGSTFWYPTCQVGRRLCFGWSWSTAHTSTGEPIILKGNAKNGNGLPPTNYDGPAQKKPHFNDNSWMINKAVETMHTGGYADVYAICTNVRN